MTTFTDADLADDAANYAVTRWEEGKHPENVAEERAYGCGCRAVRVHTIAGWQWVDAPQGDCDDDVHRDRATRSRG